MGTKRPAGTSKLQISLSGVFTDVFSTVKIEGPDSEVLFEDLTDLASEEVEDGEVVGLATPGTIKIEGWLDDADPTHVAIMNQIHDPATNKYASWKLITAHGSTRAFTGTAKNFTPMMESKKFQNYQGEIKLRRRATFTAAP